MKEAVFRLGADYKLVRVGKSIMEGEIYFQGVSYETMNEIYNACDVLLFPSLYDGFGSPMVEAFATGLPVVASDIEVFRETSGDAAILRDPNDVSDLVSGVKLALENSEELKIKGMKRAKKFSFDRFANEMNMYYSGILG
jgi:glycosyltransferase involved in cell wall biosynthesis